MLDRNADWFDVLNISPKDTARAKELAEQTVPLSGGMMHLQDFYALSAALLYARPTRIFEIGTYLGASSQFFLALLPKCSVISIAYISADSDAEGQGFNNTELSADKVGSLVSQENRGRYTQLIGDSHAIKPADFIAEHGKMDFVFIDGDHSRVGVGQDTDLATRIIRPSGAIGWHDANPKRRYRGSRDFLEIDLKKTALATSDTYIGGVAFWSKKLEKTLVAEAA